MDSLAHRSNALPCAGIFVPPSVAGDGFISIIKEPSVMPENRNDPRDEFEGELARGPCIDFNTLSFIVATPTCGSTSNTQHSLSRYRSRGDRENHGSEGASRLQEKHDS
jgi:hypothetical protein